MAKLTLAEIEELMDKVPKLPKRFGDFMLNKSFKTINYIFYKKKGKQVTGLCTKCKNEVLLKKAKHNTKYECPSCKTICDLKAINKAKSYEDSEIVSILQKMGKSYIVRYFKVIRIFKDETVDTSNFPEVIPEQLRTPEHIWTEGSRVVISQLESSHPIWRNYENFYDYTTGITTWKNEWKRSVFFCRELYRDSNPLLYKENLKRVLKNSRWKYCGLDYFTGTHINIDDYLYKYESEKALEFLSKLKLNKLLVQVVESTRNYGYSNTVIDINKPLLGLKKEIFKRVVALNLGKQEIVTLKDFDKKGLHPTDEQFRWITTKVNAGTFLVMMKYTTIHKAIEYLKSQSDDHENTLIDWRDYLDQCKTLKLDLNNTFNLFPKHLIKKHDEYTELIRHNQSESIKIGVKKVHEAFNEKLNYKSGNHMIMVAKSNKEVIDEGAKLRHCVGQYGRRISEGESIILFIRKKKDESFYTLDLDPVTFEVKQVQGQNRIGVTKEVQKFINKWQMKCLMKLCKSQETQVS